MLKNKNFDDFLKGGKKTIKIQQILDTVVLIVVVNDFRLN